jgi:hypothetical protein
MLSAHPRIYITHEASFYVWEKLVSRRLPARAFLDYYFQTHSFRWLRLNPIRVLKDLPDPLPRESVGAAFTAIMREKAAAYGRVRFGDKTPSHSHSLRRIFEDFPQARVLHIVRDPRATALSLRRMPFASASLYANAVICELDWRHVSQYRDRVLTLRLEDLLADARQTMARVLDYVGEPWHDAVLDHVHHAPATDDMPPLPWLEGATRERRAPQVSWPDATPLEIRMMEYTAGRLMREAGYTPAPLERTYGRLALWGAQLRELPTALRSLLIFARLGRMARDVRTFECEAARALYRRANPAAWRHYPDFQMPQVPPLERAS